MVALGLRRDVEPEEVFPGGEFFIVASFSGLDIAIKGFQGFGSWSFGGEQWRGQDQTGQKNESSACAFLNCGRGHARNMRKWWQVCNGLQVNRDQ